MAGALEAVLKEVRSGTLIFPGCFSTPVEYACKSQPGLLAISEIHSAIVALRNFVPVIGVIAGHVGCFGGMGIAQLYAVFW